MKLVIAEKPSVAQSIAGVLGAKSRKDGYIEGADYIVTWCVGHLVGLVDADKYDPKFAKWRIEDLPILPNIWKFEVASDKKKQFGIIKNLLSDSRVDEVICATDAGREGELIFRLVYNQAGCKKPFKRLWISSMEEVAIKQGFENLKPGTDYDNLYEAAVSRSEADWSVGINATRAYTVTFNSKLNLGRVQTPTLALLVKREQDIANFVPQEYFTISVDLQSDLTDETTKFTAKTKRVDDKDMAEKILQDVVQICAQNSQPTQSSQNQDLLQTEPQEAANFPVVNEQQSLAQTSQNQDAATLPTVTNIQQKNKTVPPPRLYDLTTLQREANRLFGFTAQETLTILQGLYESKLVTYPRTDSQFITDDMEETLQKVCENLLKNSANGSTTDSPSHTINTSKTVNNKKVSDHHAIIPTLTGSTRKMNNNLENVDLNSRKLFSLICNKTVCAVADSHKYLDTIVTIDCAGHEFEAKGKFIQEWGWKAEHKKYYDAVKSTLKRDQKPAKTNSKKSRDADDDDEKSDEDKDITLPKMNIADKLYALDATKLAKFTKPLKHYTEDTLLSSMETAGNDFIDEDTEKKGIGTPATRASIIEGLVRNRFVERQKKNLIPTVAGTSLIAVAPDELKTPKLTAEWENRLTKISSGDLDSKTFMDGIFDMTRTVVAGASDASANAPAAAFGAHGREVLGKCKRCGADVTESPKAFGCVRRGCGYVLWKNDRTWTNGKKNLTKTLVKKLLVGPAEVKGLYSIKTNKTYDVWVTVEDHGGKYPQLKVHMTEPVVPIKGSPNADAPANLDNPVAPPTLAENENPVVPVNENPVAPPAP
jgi:DNA topoisomerase-3